MTIVSDLSNAEHIAERDHNDAWNSFYRIAGKWYRFQHDGAYLHDAKPVTEEEVLDHFKWIEENQSLIPFDGNPSTPKPGTHLLYDYRKIERAVSHPVEMSLVVLPDGADTTVGTVVRWVEEGRFDDEMDSRC